MLDNFREWLSDNLRYILLGLAILAVLLILFFGGRALIGIFRSDPAPDAQQTERFKSLINTKRQFFLEELICRDDIPSDIRDKLSQVKKTNFDRIVQDPDMRKFLGISYSEGKYSLDEEFITPQLKLVLQDLVDDMSVGKIYQKRDRQEYIRELRERLENTDYVNYQDTDNEHNNKKQSFYEKINKEGDNFNNNFTKRRQGYFQNRKCLIPSNTNIPIQNPRIKKSTKN